MIKQNCLVFLSGLIAMFFLASCKPTPEEAIAYNDNLTSLQKSIDLKEQALVAALYEKNIPAMEKAHSAYMLQVDLSIKELVKFKSFEGKEEYSNAMQKLFDSYKEVGLNEYAQIIRNIKKSKTDSTFVDSGRSDQLLENANNKLNKALENTSREQDKFARKYDIEVDNN